MPTDQPSESQRRQRGGETSSSRANRAPAAASPRHEFLTLKTVCAELGISRSTFYDWRKKGVAPRCIRIPNGDLLIRRADFDRWIESREEAA